MPDDPIVNETSEVRTIRQLVRLMQKYVSFATTSWVVQTPARATGVPRGERCPPTYR